MSTSTPKPPHPTKRTPRTQRTLDNPHTGLAPSDYLIKILNAKVYDVLSAAVMIGAIPPLLIYFFGGKYFVRGLTQGAIK